MRGKSTKLLTTLPPAYSADWLERFDKRTKIWRAATEREAALLSDAGGVETLSHAKQSVIRRAVFLELLAETYELRFAAGEPLDVGAFTQIFNSMIGAYKLLGLERRAKPTQTLRDIMRADPDPEPEVAAEEPPDEEPEVADPAPESEP